MATIAAINTSFTATTENLERGTKRAEGMVRNFSRSVEGFSAFGIPSIGTIVAAAGLGLAVKHVVASFRDELSELSNLWDQSLNIGIDPQQLQHLQFGAEQAGVSADQFADAMARMQRNIADAADGSGEAGDSLKKLGLSADQLAGMTPDKQLRLIADGIKYLEGPTQRVQAAMDIFGRSGVQLLGTLENGGEGLDDIREKARRLGANLTELDFALSDMADDALGQVAFAWDSLKKQLLVEIAPALIFIAESIGEWIGSMREGGEETYELSRGIIAFFGWLADGAQEMMAIGAELNATFLTASAKVKEFFGDAEEAARMFDEAADLFKRAEELRENPISEQWQKRLDEIIKAAEESAKRAAERRKAAGAAGDRDGERGGKGIRDATPAALEMNTASAIEQFNKNQQAKSKEDWSKRQWEEMKRALAELRRIEANTRGIDLQPVGGQKAIGGGFF
jgi:methyl-accepting chemotaxis protein